MIGDADQWAMVDFQGDRHRANRALPETWFSNASPALRWFHGFPSLQEANNFRARCKEGLAYQSGKIGEWITPHFTVVESKVIRVREAIRTPNQRQNRKPEKQKNRKTEKSWTLQY